MATTRERHSRLTGREPAFGILLERSMQGDEEGTEALFSLLDSQYGQKVLARLRHSRSQAHTQTIEDVMQDSLVELLRRIREGELKDLSTEKKDAVATYFQKLCDGKLANVVRGRVDPLFARNKLQVPNTVIDEQAEIPGDSDTRQSRHQRLLNSAVVRLGDEEQRVMELYRAGVPLADIAKDLGKTEGAVQFLVFDAKRRLLLDIASTSPTAKQELHRSEERRNRVPTREEVEKVVKVLPPELKQAVTFIHLDGGTAEQLAQNLGQRGREKVATRLKTAYRSLSGRMRLPFPETFEKMGL